MRVTHSIEVKVWVGLREGYDGALHALSEVETVVQGYVDAEGLCCSVTPTTFAYTGGHEPGAVVGLMNYPRFPSDLDALFGRAEELAKILGTELGQLRVSVLGPYVTKMLEKGVDY